MYKYKIKLYRTAKSRIPVCSTKLYSEDVIKDLESIISTYFFAKIENLDTGGTMSLNVAPCFLFGNTLGYLPVLRTSGGKERPGLYIVGVKPLNASRFKIKATLGHFPEYGEKKLSSTLPITRCFSSNKFLALKYYKNCALCLKKQNLLINISEHVFSNLHDSNSVLQESYEAYSSANNKNETPRIII